MKHGEAWWVDFEPLIGGKIRKQRPAVILSNDASNEHLNRQRQTVDGDEALRR